MFDAGLRHDRYRSGLTLIELVLALALSSMLMAAMVGVLRSTSIQAVAVDSMQLERWPVRFVDRLRRDLQSADSLWSTGGEVIIRCEPPSYAAAQPSAIKPGNRTVRYRCIEFAESGPALLRIDTGRPCVLGLGPRKMVVERVDRLGNPQPLPNAPGPLPPQVRCWVWGDDDSEPILSIDVVLR